MKWLFYRYGVFRALCNDYNMLEAWRYSARFKQHMLDGLNPKLAVEWEKTFGIVERWRISRPAKVIYDPASQPKWIILNPDRYTRSRS